MTTTTIILPRATVEQALEALKYFRDTAICSADTDTANEVIPDLEAVLAQQAEPTQQAEPVEPVATITECEACFTPDVCQLRGTCDYYTASQMRIAALAQQAEPVEPVAWMFELARNFNLEGYGGWEKRITEYRPNTPEGSVRNVTPLYTAPPKLVPLTEEEIEDIYLAWDVTPGRRIVCLVRAVERALEEKNRGR